MTPERSKCRLIIGVLALQGAFEEHVVSIERVRIEDVQIETRLVRYPADLMGIHGLILPGGESTAIRTLSASLAQVPGESHVDNGMSMLGHVREWYRKVQRPIWGTCAGMILLANKLDQDRKNSTDASFPEVLGLLDVAIERNAYGTHAGSFVAPLDLIQDFHKDVSSFLGVFIRAPAISKIGPQVQVLARHNDQPVAVQQGRIMASSFHPELGNDTRFHQYFCRLALKHA